RRALGGDQEPVRHPQMAAGRATLQPEAVSGGVRPHPDRADAGPDRQDRPVPAPGDAARRRRRRAVRAGAGRRGGGRRHRGAAARLSRRAMNLDPPDPAAAFNLANLLRTRGRALEAEALYRQAVERDRAFAGAWYNLADVLDEQGRTAEGIAALERAIEADPAYADAIFNLALFLQKLERYAEAMVWWRQYPELDADSQWSMRAKRALKLCEIQVAGSS